jgi:hypothetical protein
VSRPRDITDVREETTGREGSNNDSLKEEGRGFRSSRANRYGQVDTYLERSVELCDSDRSPRELVTTVPEDECDNHRDHRLTQAKPDAAHEKQPGVLLDVRLLHLVKLCDDSRLSTEGGNGLKSDKKQRSSAIASELRI